MKMAIIWERCRLTIIIIIIKILYLVQVGLYRHCWDVDSSVGCQQTRCLPIPVRFYTHVGVRVMTELCDAVPGVLRGRFPLNSSQITPNSARALLHRFPIRLHDAFIYKLHHFIHERGFDAPVLCTKRCFYFLYSPFTFFTDCKKSMRFISGDCIDFICTAPVL